MNAFYDRMRALALRLVNEKGGDATLTRISRTVSADRRSTVETPTAQACKAVLVPPSNMSVFRLEGGTPAYSKLAVVAASGLAFAPEPGDTLSLADTAYKIEAVKAMEPDGEAIIHILGLGND